MAKAKTKAKAKAKTARAKTQAKKTKWKKGPLPPDTWNWGGVVESESNPSGFFFADFCGDHVMLMTNPPRKLQAHGVVWYNNCLELPPVGRGGKRL